MAKQFREQVVIESNVLHDSGLTTKQLINSSPVTAGATPIGVDGVGKVVRVDPVAGTALFTFTDGTTTQTISGWDTLTFTSGNWITTTVSATDVLTIAAKLSTDAGNDITIGTDGGLYLSKDSLLTNVTWNDVTNNLVLTFDNGSTVNVPIVDNLSTFLMDLTISDGTTTDVVNNHETITFAAGDVMKAVVTPNTVTYSHNTTWALAGQSVSYNGTSVVRAYPTPARYVNTRTPVANVATVHTHALNTTNPIIQVRDTATNEIVDVEIVIISGTQFTVTSTTTDSLTVVWL